MPKQRFSSFSIRPKKTTVALPYICAVLLFGVVILFIAGTVAIALIPVYLSGKQVTLNTGS